MSLDATALRWLLFLGLFWTWPLPLLGLDGSAVPLARFVQLAISLGILILIEGAGGMVGTLLLLFWGHVLVYGLLLFGVAWIAARGLRAWLPERAAGWLALALVAALIAWGSVGRPYDTIFHHSDAHASLWTLYR